MNGSAKRKTTTARESLPWRRMGIYKEMRERKFADPGTHTPPRGRQAVIIRPMSSSFYVDIAFSIAILRVSENPSPSPSPSSN
jgi:hypothetical protein